jgi:hypothetical protein
MATNHQVLKLDENGNVSTVDYTTEIKDPIDASVASHINQHQRSMIAAGYGYVRYCANDEHNSSAVDLKNSSNMRVHDHQFIRCINWAAKAPHSNRPFDFGNGNCTLSDIHGTPQTGCWWVHTTHLLGNNL